MSRSLDARELSVLHDDAERCASVAGLVYVNADAPGWQRRRAGKGFSYRSQGGGQLAESARQRIASLAIPPAWTSVWICPDADGHILATGFDERGRKQYIYHPRWRELRDMINFYRLLVIAEALPKIRAHYLAQLRRRTIDKSRVIAGMIALLDETHIRIGHDVYAEENDSYGLSTLTRRHVRLQGKSAVLSFPAKSNKAAKVSVDDPAIVRLLRQLVAQGGKRLFEVDGSPVSADEVNQALWQLSGEHITAKDFRTWGGTLAAFVYLRERQQAERAPAKVAIEALDEAAEQLGNTRAVARAHYVHPHVIQAFSTGSFGHYLRLSKPARSALLNPDERLLAAFLKTLSDAEFSALEDAQKSA